MTYRSQCDRRAERTMTRATRIALRLEKPGPKPTPATYAAILRSMYPQKRVMGLALGVPNRALWASMALASGWMTEAQFESVPLEQPEYFGSPFSMTEAELVEFARYDRDVRFHLDRARKSRRRRRR